MAAWKGGHRPGASQHQWAYARVNSFVTKSSGTWGGADKDFSCQSKRRIKMSYLESKSGSISEVVKEMQKHKIKDNAYQDMFKKELEKNW